MIGDSKVPKNFQPGDLNRYLIEEHQIDPVIFPFDLFKFDKEGTEGYDIPGIIAGDGYLEVTLRGVVFTGLVAGEDIAALKAVCVDASGEVLKGDKGTAAKVNVIGFSASGVSEDDKIRVVTAGQLGGFEGLTPKEPIYLDDAGAIVQTLAGFAVTDYVVPLGTALSETEIEIHIDSAKLFSKYNPPTYAELQEGYTSGGGTKTPTAPTISVCKPVATKAILIEWDRQLDLTNLDRYEVQVSSDDTNWYDLRFDGVDWKGTINLDTDVDPERIIHTNIPHGGAADAPTGTTLYYRVRRVTKAPVVGDWSTSASATTNTVEAGDLAANSIYANNLIAATVQTMMMRASEIWVGYGGTGSYDDPDDGDRRVFIDDDELKIQYYDTDTWVDRISLGYQVMKAYDENAVLLHDIPDSAILDGYASLGHLYTFDNNISHRLINATLATGAWTDFGPVYTEGMGNVKGVLLYIWLYATQTAGATIQIEPHVFIRPKGTSWSATIGYPTPLVHNRFFLSGLAGYTACTVNASGLVACPVGTDDYLQYYTSASPAAPSAMITQLGVFV